ncbi:thiamine-phosphate kinase [Amycolatopsis sp. YIM 10]|uniref:thiamine-phosphate kinase n=1 Tax=Amycolatopsis sp. YIM 10 TaxID=2653857 RepID=UPI00129086D1|nr:thiamine-phosphate kinase [Amycolatopsis sp. YIM 10]QFU85873.1 Thiamine-monophosphate kinase [Amycolatopsis sp. YIM 10]
MRTDREFSDEPTRLANTVVPLFRAQNAAFEQVSQPGRNRVDLLAGVEAQDDCAVFRFRGDHELVVGSDYVRGPKFRLYEMGHLDEYDLGYYLVAANLSDIAAMGARPIGLLSVVRYPPDMTDAVFRRVLEGIRDACAAWECPNVGGDIGGAERLILSASALGVCPAGGTLFRTGAKPGDAICLTAATGFAGAAMAYLRAADPHPLIEETHLETMLAYWRRPVARIESGLALSASGVVTSCQDTSDGLKAALAGLAQAGAVGVEVQEKALQVPDAVSAVAAHLGLDPLSVVLGDSVDFELLFTAPEDQLGLLAGRLDFHQVGVVTERRDVVLVREDGTRAELPGKAWRHTPRDPADVGA